MAPPVAQWPHFATPRAEPHTPSHPPVTITFMRYDPQTKNDVILEDSDVHNPPSSAPPALGYFARPFDQPLHYGLPESVPQCDSSGQQVQEQMLVDNTAPSHSVSLPSSADGFSRQPVMQSMGARPHTLFQHSYPMRDARKVGNPNPYGLNIPDWDRSGLPSPPNLEAHYFNLSERYTQKQGRNSYPPAQQIFSPSILRSSQPASPTRRIGGLALFLSELSSPSSSNESSPTYQSGPTWEG